MPKQPIRCSKCEGSERSDRRHEYGLRANVKDSGHAVDRKRHPEPQWRIYFDDIAVKTSASSDLLSDPQLPGDVRIDRTSGSYDGDECRDDERDE
jgi:hypothetical protein